VRYAYFMMFAHVAVFVQYLQVHLRSLGYRNDEVGLLMGVLQISGVAGALIVGAIVDRHPITRTLLAVGIAGSTLFLVVLGAMPGLLAALPVVVAMGMLHRTEVPLLDTHASLVLGQTGQDYGSLRVWGSIGFVVISLAFQLLGYPRPDREGSIVTTFIVVAAAYLVAVTVLPRARSAPISSQSPDRARLPRSFPLVIAIVILSNTGFSVHSSFFSLYVQDMLPGFLVSGAWAIGAVAEIPIVLYGGPTLRKLGVRSMLALAGAGMAARLIVYAAAPHTAPVLAAQLLHALTFGALHIAGMGYVTTAVQPESRGKAVSIYSALGFGLPGLLGGVLGGQLLEAHGFSTMFWIFALAPALGAAIAAFAGAPIDRATRDAARPARH
jgi:PPP family 3-phenylpropionic acid transporter